MDAKGVEEARGTGNSLALIIAVGMVNIHGDVEVLD